MVLRQDSPGFVSVIFDFNTESQKTQRLIFLFARETTADEKHQCWNMIKIVVKYLLSTFAVTAMLSCGQNEPLTNYEAKSPQEQALKGVLLDFQDGVNTQDSNKVKDLIHEKASIMTGRDRKILSKAEYIKILPKRLAENPSIALGKPKMRVSGDTAEVKIYMARGNYNALVVFNMKLEKNIWYIQSWRY